MRTKKDLAKFMKKFQARSLSKTDTLTALRQGLTSVDKASKKAERDIGKSERSTQQSEIKAARIMDQRNLWLRAIAMVENN